MKKKLLLLGLFVFITITGFSQNYENFISKHYESNGKRLPYRVSQPSDKSKKYPLVIFLHGTGERGDDNSKQLTESGIGDFLEGKFAGEFESIIVAPQCPADTYWANGISEVNGNFVFDFSKEAPTEAMTLLMAFIKEWSANPNVDASRIYIGGMSMGAMTTFELLWRMPNTFAAAFPICGGSTANQTKLAAFAHIPLWIFHGSADDVVSVNYSRDVYQRLIQTKGNNAKYTEYANVKHPSWYNAFNEETLVPWLFGYTNLTDGYYKITYADNSLTVTNKNFTVSKFTDEKSQSWLISKATNSSYKIQATDGSNQYLSVNGNNLTLSTNANTTNQYWKLKKTSENGVFNVISEATGLALVLADNKISLVASTSNNNQKLKISQTQAFLIGDASPNGWVQSGAQKMSPVLDKDGILSWTGILRASDFKFVNFQNSWFPAINATVNNQVIALGGVQNINVNAVTSAYDYKFKMDKSGYYEVLLNTIEKTVTVNEKVLDELYLVGAAAPCGWDANNPVKMEPVKDKEGIFNWEGVMTVGDFKFITTKSSWSPSINSEVSDQEISDSPMKLVITNAVQGDNKFKISKSAIYNITVDVKNWTILVEEKSRMGIPLYLVGEATPNGWDNTKATPMEQLSDNIYSWEGEMTAGHFKFITQLGTWNSIVPANKNNESIIIDHYHTISTNYQGDYRFILPEAGTYKITVDIEKNTMVVNKLVSNKLIYLVGEATPNGWDNTKATPMEQITDNIYIWRGEMKAGHFKFITQLGTWNSIVPVNKNNESVIIDHYHTISTNYQGDYRFILPAAGVYKITVDLQNNTMVVNRPKPDKLYLVGEATPNGWDNTKATQMAQESEDIYTWEGELKAGHFKFITQLGTWYSIVPTLKAHEQIITSYNHNISEDYQGDYRFIIPETGTYSIRVSLPTMLMTVKRLPSNNLIYLVGDATPNGWYNTMATPMTEIGDGMYRWTGALKAGHFKFITQLGTWNSLVPYMSSNVNVTLGFTHHISNNYQGDPRFILEKDGTYIVTVDLKDRRMRVDESIPKSTIGESVNADFTIIPFSGYVEVKLNTTTQVEQAELIDLSGRTISVEKNHSASFKLGNNLTSGIYIVKIAYAQKTYVQKVLVK